MTIQSGFISADASKEAFGTILFPEPFETIPVVLCQAVAKTTPTTYDGKNQFPLFSIHVNNVTPSQFEYAKESIMASGTQTTASSLPFFWVAIAKKPTS